MINELKKLVSPEYPMVFHETNSQAILCDAALSNALYNELGFEIEFLNEENIEYPIIVPLRGTFGSPTFAVEIIQEGENCYVVFPAAPEDMADVYLRELIKRLTYTDLEFSHEINPEPDEDGHIDEDEIIAYHYMAMRDDGTKVEISVEVDSDTEIPVWELKYEESEDDWIFLFDMYQQN